MTENRTPLRTWKIKFEDWILYDEEINASTLKLYIHLLRFMNERSRLAWPSITKLEQRSRLSRSTVCRALRKLEMRGLITRVESSTLTVKYKFAQMVEVYFHAGEVDSEGNCTIWTPKKWFAESLFRRGLYQEILFGSNRYDKRQDDILDRDNEEEVAEDLKEDASDIRKAERF